MLEKLRRLAADGNPYLRAWAVRRLGKLYPEEAGEELAGALEDDNPEVVKEACLAIVDNPPESAKTTLLRLVESDDPIVAGCAVSALGNMGCKEAVEKIARLLERNGPGLKLPAITALAKIGGEEAENLLLRLIEEGDGNALIALAMLGSSRAAEIAKQWILEGREAGVEALAEYFGVAHEFANLREYRKYGEEILKSKLNKDFARKYRKLLRKFKQKKVSAFIRELANAEKDKAKALAMLEELARKCNRKTGELLLILAVSLLAPPHESIEVELPDSVSQLLELLDYAYEEEDDNLAEACIRALARKGREAVDEIDRYIRGDGRDKIGACFALGNMVEEKAVDVLLNYFQNPPEGLDRTTLVVALAESGSPRAIEPLRSVLEEEPDHQARVEAKNALVELCRMHDIRFPGLEELEREVEESRRSFIESVRKGKLLPEGEIPVILECECGWEYRKNLKDVLSAQEGIQIDEEIRCPKCGSPNYGITRESMLFLLMLSNKEEVA